MLYLLDVTSEWRRPSEVRDTPAAISNYIVKRMGGLVITVELLCGLIWKQGCTFAVVGDFGYGL